MYAVVKTGGKQFKVEVGETVPVERLDAPPASTLTLPVLLVSDGEKVVAGEEAAKAQVTAEIVRHGKADKVIVFKFKKRKGYKNTRGHRQDLTLIKITDIVLPGGKRAASKAAEAPVAAAVEAPAKRATARTTAPKAAAKKASAPAKAPAAPKAAAATKAAAAEVAEKKPARKAPAAKSAAVTAKKPAAKASAPKAPAAKAAKDSETKPARTRKPAAKKDEKPADSAE